MKVKKLKPKKEIPLKQVTLKFIEKDCVGIIVQYEGIFFLGTPYFLLKKDIALENYLTKIISLKDFRILDSTVAKAYLGSMTYKEYDSSDLWCEYEIQNNIIFLKSKKAEKAINYTYYSYLKSLGFEFRFRDSSDSIGLFKEKEFVGILLPIRVTRDSGTEYVPADDEDIPF